MFKNREKLKERILEIHNNNTPDGKILTRNDIVAVDVVMDKGKQPCPFLLDFECSIYKARPVVCRSYIVEGSNVDCVDVCRSRSSSQSLEVRKAAGKKLLELDYMSYFMPLVYVAADIAAESRKIKSVYAFQRDAGG